MANIEVFSSTEFGNLHVLIVDGKEHFPATQCARILGCKNPHKAVIDHCKGDGLTNREVIDNLGRTQEVKYISEGNLYRLIIRSKLPAAQKFEAWIFDDVLPEIRRKGSYTVPGAESTGDTEAIARLIGEVVSRTIPAVPAAMSAGYAVAPDKPKRSAGPRSILTRLPEESRLELFDMVVGGEHSVERIVAWLHDEHRIDTSTKTIYRFRQGLKKIAQANISLS
jgi:prophage antirepressor-like protein